MTVQLINNQHIIIQKANNLTLLHPYTVNPTGLPLSSSACLFGHSKFYSATPGPRFPGISQRDFTGKNPGIPGRTLSLGSTGMKHLSAKPCRRTKDYSPTY